MFKQLVCGLALALTFTPIVAAASSDTPTSADRPRVLITNDNGIDDPKIVALARAFARQAETWVVAPDRDQSGTTNSVTFPSTGQLTAERRDLGEGIQAFAVAGTPADCVVLATLGLMADTPPDLVVSGINGGDNAGAEWLFSGTVGAARVAALGLPAVAVSGLDDDLPGAVEAAVDWVVRLTSHEIVTNMEPGDYLTVSLPRVSPSEIRGVKIVDRAPGLPAPRFASDDGGTTWRIVRITPYAGPVPADSDRAANAAGYIAVVPMTLNEVDLDRLAYWRRLGTDLPVWRQLQTAED